MKSKIEILQIEIADCQVCQPFLTHSVNPLVKVHSSNKVLVIGQAPGLKVHQNSKLWQDKSGDNLRMWLGVNDAIFEDSNVFGFMPMGFCYPGKGSSGDLPPRPECAPLWHDQILPLLGNVSLTLLVGQYAQNYYLKNPKKNLTETVMNFRHYLPKYLPLPHPSPRNFIWQSKNPWFKEQLLPELRERIHNLL